MVSRSLQIIRTKTYTSSSFEKSIVERAIEYVKDRTEGFDDYYPCRKSVVVDCNIVHVYRWISLFKFLRILSKSQSELNILKFLVKKRRKDTLT